MSFKNIRLMPTPEEIKKMEPISPELKAIKDENDKPYVFKSYDGILKKQKIEIQSQNDEFTVVKDGLDKQDIIIR